VSFDMPIKEILQYGYNTFSSFAPLVYLWAGSALALWIIFEVIRKTRGGKE
jgi:hypothetical protein